MLKRAWKPILGTAVVVGTPTYIYYRYYSTKRQGREIFDIPVRVRGSDGKPTTISHSVNMISKEQLEARLKEHMEAVITPRPNGITWKHTTAYLASNDPIEDANANKIIERDPSEHSPAGDLVFYAVMDGHGGPNTSRLLSKVLLPAVALELHSLINEPASYLPKAGLLQNWKAYIWPTTTVTKHFDADPTYISLAIQTAFANLDSEIINAPLRIIAEELSKPDVSKNTVPDLSQHPMAMATMLPAMSGSCALMALFDTAHDNLYVACTGDCRAVAGVWEESVDGTGSWRTDVLTEDQTGRNPNELARMQSEHPADERDTVIMRGRVLGGLEPTRAFGDARYKWSREIQELLSWVFLKGNNESMRATPALLKTPPYVTPRPVVTHRKLSLHSSSSDPNSPKSKLRFLVLATDGLWDQLSSEEVVSLVGGHLQGLKGIVPKSDLQTLVPTSSGKTVEGKDKRSRNSKKGGSWAFADENLSTHLIRNAFGGGDEVRLRQLLSIPAPYARNYRDDVTCTVVYWEDGQENEAKTTTFSVEQKGTKAKL
ncbi:PPM-type phosphatase-like domain superfamily protein [Abortiporus biennis]